MAELNGAPATAAELEALALINYGHFTTMLVDDGRVRGLADHLDRLIGDARRVFDAELDRDRLRGHLRSAIGDRSGSFLVRITAYDPAADLLHPDGEPSILITTRPAAPTSPPPPPLRLRTITGRRDPAMIKHVGLFGVLWSRRQARRDGYDDALLVGADELITEGPTWNIGFVDHDHVLWPEAAVLPGITQRLLQPLDPGADRRPVFRSDLSRLTAAFATSSGFGVRPIAAIDGHDFPVDHPLLGRLARAYRDLPGEAP
ncbi:aminotransferase class IV [Microlunatus speluncae]|uniref:aminotransferase class IV n=1 Tax=Microlunatus speluncae TaxID=2594267 RepID=UPI00126661CA|nr:aminotransferase class IV [Microlunatus speluncae]